jgi:hypothetical protein
MLRQISEITRTACPLSARNSAISNRLLIMLASLLFSTWIVEPASAQDEQCRNMPVRQCQCSCRQVRTAASLAPRGTCRVIEPGDNSCQLRWWDAARGDNEKLTDPAGASRIQQEFLKRVRDGELGPKNSPVKRESLTVEALIAGVRKSDRRLPPDPTPLEAAAAYLSLDPEKQEAELLLTSYLILLGPPVQMMAPEKTATLVDFLASELGSIFERIRSSSAPSPRPYKIDGNDIVDESARGCLELTIRAPVRPERPEPLILMIKTPHSIGSRRCRE